MAIFLALSGKNLILKILKIGGPPKLHGIACAYHSAAAGSNPKHTICAFPICIIEIVMRKGQK